MIWQIALVALGGAFGSVLRHLVGLVSVRLLGAGFPYGTLVVNLAGSFAMGVLIEVLARRFADSADLRLLLATGVLGGFTTFSSFSLDVSVLIERGDLWLALLYVAASVLVGIGALFLGLGLARHLA